MKPILVQNSKAYSSDGENNGLDGMALLEDAKKARNDVITNSRVLAGVMAELEKLFPKALASLKRVRTTAVRTTTGALFTHTTLPGKSKSTTLVLSLDSCESEGFLLEVEATKNLGISQEENQPTATQMLIHEPELQEENAAPATGVVIRELGVDVPMRDV
ncbi:hypothetical protein Cgig2_028584 [Carnegiea gigantea]|uniref:Uncharacterized protein n=1 Tax=Carnegiea gigantea TaxID=171969 RepID=A0A9Q1GG59_9CARY|nr:hypothetical protein Cgig2_021478 [Carnegiea gigantea]KAJ8432999.1 hypothetical protein Cgig2_028584 [Carnegiea gigantea]